MKYSFLAFLLCLFFSSAALAAFNPDIDKVPSFEENFDKPIDSAVWEVAGWKEHGGQTSPERCYAKDGMLNMLFRYDGATKSNLSSAIETRKTFLYGRWEYRAKPSSVKGVLNSFYTIDWGEGGKGTKQEIDIEFLTGEFVKNTGKVNYAVHAAGHKSGGPAKGTELNFNPSEDFHIYGFEITPDKIDWFVDDKVLYTYTYSGNDIKIDSPYTLKLNFWSSKKWINGPPKADTDCLYLVDWIKFYPYKAGNK